MIRSKGKAVGILVMSVLQISGCTQEPKDPLLAESIAVLRQNHINSAQVDWKAIEAKLVNMQPQLETGAAIRYVIDKLGERHTVWITAADASKTNFLSFDQEATDRSIREIESRVVDGVAVVSIPQFGLAHEASAQQFSDALQRRIVELGERKHRGWVIDLRKNWGGNMWPMLAGLGCFFDSKPLGYLAERDGSKQPWSVVGGAAIGGTIGGADISRMRKFAVSKLASENWSDGPTIYAQTTVRCPLRLEGEPVVVLTGAWTASSGEAVAISLLSLPTVKFVGAKTRGMTTGNRPFKLKDGSVLLVTTSIMHSADGRSFLSGIDPQNLGNQGFAVEESKALDKALSLLAK